MVRFDNIHRFLFSSLLYDMCIPPPCMPSFIAESSRVMESEAESEEALEALDIMRVSFNRT